MFKLRYRWLKMSLQTILVDYMYKCGYEEYKKSKKEHPYVAISFRRTINNQTHQIDLKTDKCRSSFMVIFGVLPPEGVQTETYFTPFEELHLVDYLRKYYILRPTFLPAWTFWPRRLPWRAATEKDYVNLVKRLIRVIPQIDRVLLQGKRSLNVTYYDL